MEAAWRWRFGRRWVQEQAKQFDPDFQNEDAEEEWDDALGYLDACGPGFNLIARTSSEFGENHSKNHSLVSQDSGVSKSLNSLLLDEGSFSQHEVRSLSLVIPKIRICLEPAAEFYFCLMVYQLRVKHFDVSGVAP